MKFEFNKDEWSRSFIKPGGYIGKIVNVLIDGEYIQVVFDIAEGAYKGCFLQEYQKSNGTRRFDINKWNKKGVMNYDFQYAGAKYAFADFLECLEKSNQTFHWNNETNDLKNKIIGVVYKKNTYEDKFGIEREGTDFPEFVTVMDINNNAYSIDPKEKSISEVKTEDNKESASFNIMEDDIQF